MYLNRSTDTCFLKKNTLLKVEVVIQLSLLTEMSGEEVKVVFSMGGVGPENPL